MTRNLSVLFWSCLLCAATTSAFAPTTRSRTSSSSSVLFAVPPVDPSNVQILGDADGVGAEIRSILRESAAQAIAEKGTFCLAIPGGSILKMLVGTGCTDEDKEWTSKTIVAYVNHKCVPMDDKQLATHAKAKDLFFKDWSPDCNILTMDGTNDGDAEAAAYEQKLKDLVSDNKLSLNKDGIPVFDLSLVGVGDDGHIGSLYPDREEVLETQKWVLPVAMKDPPSITLSLPVMQASTKVVIAACGVSDKYPQGKSAGMKRAIADDTESLTSFPAVGLRPTATWVVDKAAASKLGDNYQ